MDELKLNVTIFRSDKTEYLLRVFIPGHPLAYVVFKEGRDPAFIQNVDDRRVAAHRWQRASLNQIFHFEGWPNSDLTSTVESRITRGI